MIKSRIELEMIKTVHLLKRLIDEKIAETIDKNLSVSQAHLIGYISNEGEHNDIYQKDIEEHFELHRSSVSLMLNNMEKNGLIRRLSDDNDARLKKIVLTEKAFSLQDKINASVSQVNEKMLKDVSEEELQTFITVLAKIKSNIK